MEFSIFKESKIKEICQVIIEDYTYFVRDEFHKGREEYRKTGIDNDLELYKKLFLEILSISLGLKDTEPNKNSVFKEELVCVLQKIYEKHKYKNIVMTNRARIYRTCEVIFDKVIEGIIGGGILEVR